MNTPPKIGQRVLFISPWGRIAGAVVSTSGRHPFNPDKWFASILIDARFGAWPFPSRRLAAPISEIRPLA